VTGNGLVAPLKTPHLLFTRYEAAPLADFPTRHSLLVSPRLLRLTMRYAR
jgi:hypothetical protein